MFQSTAAGPASSSVTSPALIGGGRRPSGFLPPTMSYVRHRTSRTMSYVNVRCRTSHIRHRTCSSQHMSYVRNGHTMSYVHDIRHRMLISYTTSYVRTMSYVNIRHRMLDVRCRMSVGGGRFSCFKATRSPAHSTCK